MTTLDPAARERAARADVAVTQIPRGVVWLLLFGFAGTLAVQPLLEWRAWRRGEWRTFAASITPGGGTIERWRHTIAELELGYDERSALVRTVRPHAQALLYEHAGYGNERVVVGRDGWLFFAEDVRALLAPRPADATRETAGAIAALERRLAARGIALLAAPVPVKPAIHPERLVSDLVPPLAQPGFARLLGDLESAGVAALDLTPLLARRARLHGAAYLERDTHWRPEAIDEAARELAIELRALAALPPGRDDLDREEAAEVAGAGDTALLLDLPPHRRPAPQRVPVRMVRRAGGTPPASDQDAVAAPVLVLGDSFAAVFGQGDLGWGTGAGLVERLAFHLGVPVDAVLRNAGGAPGAIAALDDTLAYQPDRLAAVRAVVLVFSAR